MTHRIRTGDIVITNGAQVGTVVHVYTDEDGTRRAYVRIRETGIKGRYDVSQLTVVR